MQEERLETAQTSDGANDSHSAAIGFHKPRNDEMEACANIVRGKIFTDEEISGYKASNRLPIAINKALAPFRTVMGTISQSGFDADFLPFDESDQPLAEILGKLAIYESKQNDDEEQNAQMCQNAYITGRAFRMCWVEQGGDMKPRLRSKVLNPYAVYFDPDSSDAISRQDAQFVDVVHWMSIEEIAEAFPHCESDISADREDRLLKSDFEKYDHSANRKHEEDVEELNGKRRVIERYYRVKPRGGQEMLYLAVWSPGTLGSGKFLCNGPYHVQPRDPATGKVIFPIVELVADSIMGESDGFVKFLKDPIKMVSHLYTQILDAAKYSGSGYLVNRDAFITPEEADRAIKYGAAANQRYALNPKANPNAAMVPVQKPSMPSISMEALALTTQFIEDASSAPKALQGIKEGSNTAASLNAQRIEQASTQLSVFFSHYKKYLQRMLKLRYAYWRESYTDQMTFRITQPDGGTENVTLNQQVPELDYAGQKTGKVAKVNDLSAAQFDIVIGDSFKSPTYRKKITEILGEMLKNPAIAQNPAISPILTEGIFEASDAPTELKEKVKQAQQQQMQAQQQQMQAQQQQMQAMQMQQQPMQQGAAQ